MGCRCSCRSWCCWKGVLAFEERVGQGCSVPAPRLVLVRDQVWISGVLFQGWGVYGRNRKHSGEASGERRNCFSKYVLPRALTWLCFELKQSKLRNVGFLRCGFCCCAFPDSRFLRLILSEFPSYIFGKSAAWHRPTVWCSYLEFCSETRTNKE